MPNKRLSDEERAISNEKRMVRNRRNASAWRARNPEKAIEQRRLWHTSTIGRRWKSVRYKTRRAFFDEIKAKPCADCGIQYPSYVMEFDHVRGVKSFPIGSGIFCHTMKVLIEEIAKCELVCANCHAERTHSRLKPRYAEPRITKAILKNKVSVPKDAE